MGVVTASLLGCVIVLLAPGPAGLLLLASRPVLDQLNDHRWADRLHRSIPGCGG